MRPARLVVAQGSPGHLRDGRRPGLRPLLAGIAVALAAWTASPPAARAASTALLYDDFEGEPANVVRSDLRKWTSVNNVDILDEHYVSPLCRRSGTCIDLVGTAGTNIGEIRSKLVLPAGDYHVGFLLYGSGRDGIGNGVVRGGTIDKLRVYLGTRLIYANTYVPSYLARYVVVDAHGSGRLRFVGIGQAVQIGPLIDDVVVFPATVE